MELIDQIRQEYPDPRRASISIDTLDYCVGGAMCLFANKHALFLFPSARFPNSLTLTMLLREYNPGLIQNSPLAGEFADAILRLNDAGCFTEAWEVAAAALVWRP